jgi:DNA repair and recombination protein RAD52
MTFTDEMKAELAKPLNPAHVNPPKKFGPKGDYIEGWHCIAELNRIFGFDGWSYTVQLTKDDLREGQDKEGGPQWQAAYTCICTLTVGDVMRQDVGFGSGFAKGIGDAIEGAAKEATTDALKRAARTFGNPFGLALYDKSRANVKPPETPMITVDQIGELQAMIEGYGFNVGGVCKSYNIQSLAEIPAEEFVNVRNNINAQYDKKKQKTPS